jgi:hypothetical protein
MGWAVGIGQPYARVDHIPMTESTLSPSHGLRTEPLVIFKYCLKIAAMIVHLER